jgi:signal peptidase II
MRMKSKLSRFFVIILLLSGTVGCDQATKSIARSELMQREPITFAKGSVRLEYAENKGAFLNAGAGLDSSLRFWIFIAGVAIALSIATYFLIRKSKMSLLKTSALALIIAGGLGNLIDRVVYGYVTDFINVGLGPVRTGIFNIADVAIVIGVLILLLPEREPSPAL